MKSLIRNWFDNLMAKLQDGPPDKNTEKDTQSPQEMKRYRVSVYFTFGGGSQHYTFEAPNGEEAKKIATPQVLAAQMGIDPYYIEAICLTRQIQYHCRVDGLDEASWNKYKKDGMYNGIRAEEWGIKGDF